MVLLCFSFRPLPLRMFFGLNVAYIAHYPWRRVQALLWGWICTGASASSYPQTLPLLLPGNRWRREPERRRRRRRSPKVNKPNRTAISKARKGSQPWTWAELDFSPGFKIFCGAFQFFFFPRKWKNQSYGFTFFSLPYISIPPSPPPFPALVLKPFLSASEIFFSQIYLSFCFVVTTFLIVSLEWFVSFPVGAWEGNRVRYCRRQIMWIHKSFCWRTWMLRL